MRVHAAGRMLITILTHLDSSLCPSTTFYLTDRLSVDGEDAGVYKLVYDH